MDDDIFSILDAKPSRVGKPQPVPTAKQSVITKPLPASNDPFADDVFATPAVAPAAAPVPSANPFDAFAATAPAPPVSHVVFPPAPPVNNVPAPKDEFDLLFDATPSTQPAASVPAAPSGTTPAKSAADEDFDKFFASLDVK